MASARSAATDGGRNAGAVSTLSNPMAVLLNILIRLTNIAAKVSRGGLAMAPEQEASEADLGQDIQDTVEDGLGVGVDDVAALAEAPGDGVQEPQQQQPDAARPERLLGVAPQHVGVAPRVDEQLVRDEEERRHPERPEAPLEPRLRERADEPAHDHEHVREQRDQDRGRGHARREQQLEQEQGRGDGPVDVPRVEHLACPGGADPAASGPSPLDEDGELAEVGSHGEVGDAGYSGDSCRDVME